jgi:hypothetical protein
MVRKIILIIVVIAMVAAGTLFALDKLTSSEKQGDDMVAEQEVEQKKDVKSERTIIEISKPE